MRKDLVGLQTDRGLVVSFDKVKAGNAYWFVRNDIGESVSCRGSRLVVGNAKSEEKLPKTMESESSIQGDVWNISLPKTGIHTLEQLLAYCEVDLSVWEVERFVVNKWGMISKVEGVTPLYQVKATLKRKTAVVDAKAEIAALKELAKREIKLLSRPVKSVKQTGLMLEIAMPDLHVGKQAHPAETGRRPYDVKIAVAVFRRALEALIERTKGYTVEEILLVVGNDILNSDTAEGTTTSGTHVSNDGRFFKTYIKTRTMLVSAIERLRKIAKVKVLVCPGNHDAQAAFTLGDSLECYFHSDLQVEVLNSPAPRKYIEWGNCLIGFCHGHEGKHNDYALLMASERPEEWGRTKYREMHVGHYHKLKTDEYHGTRVRILSALTEVDDWHAIKGFVGNIRQAEAFVWSKKEGLIAEVFFNDDAQEPIVTKREFV